MKQAFLKFGKDDSLRRYHPWIFSGAIHHFSEQPEEGEVVEVYAAKQKEDRKGFDFEYIASGHFQIGSIMIRVLTFEHEDINQDFYEQRLASALQMRKAVGLVEKEDSTSYRMVHGEGDNLPGLVIDVYKKTAVMQAHSVGMHVDRFVIAKALKKVMGDDLENIFYKSETTLPFKAELGQENGFLLGGSTDDIATENGLKFHVDWLRGQKTGFFVDQRENRSLL